MSYFFASQNMLFFTEQDAYFNWPTFVHSRMSDDGIINDIAHSHSAALKFGNI